MLMGFPIERVVLRGFGMEADTVGTNTDRVELRGFGTDTVTVAPAMETVDTVILGIFTVDTVVLESFTVESVVLTGFETASVTLGEVFEVEVEVALAVTETTCVVHPVVQVGQAPFAVSVIVFSHSHAFPGTVIVLVKSHWNCTGPVHFGAGHFFSGASVTVAV